MIILNSLYEEKDSFDRSRLFNLLNDEGETSEKALKFSGSIEIVRGVLNEDLSILHARSVAEDVFFFDNNYNLFSGKLSVKDGKIQDDVIVNKDLFASLVNDDIVCLRDGKDYCGAVALI